ncbi:unnamed protein product [Owenia fusiformis]|uniref:Uncharacterized protein n=1 Tax=Owenia fusiformis TaxID=6347 RepID=A0A8J1XIC9_OWEFU|nr:unnamed protein product [Owenia fusiformis]
MLTFKRVSLAGFILVTLIWMPFFYHFRGEINRLLFVKLNKKSDMAIFTYPKALMAQFDQDNNTTIQQNKKMKFEPNSLKQNNHSVASPTKYAVITSSTPIKRWSNWDYAFRLPITVEVYIKLNFKCIVIISGSFSRWTSHPALRVIYDRLKKNANVKLMFLETAIKVQTLMAMASRIFVPYFIPGLKPEDIVMMTDADLWLLGQRGLEYVSFNSSSEILITNAFCCGNFQLDGLKIPHYAMCHISMSANQWKDVLKVDSYFRDVNTTEYVENGRAKNLDKIIQKIFFDTFGVNPNVPVGIGSYLDEKMVSKRIYEYQKLHPSFPIKKKRFPKNGRVCRLHWPSDPKFNITEKVDAHLPDNALSDDSWNKTRTLMEKVFEGQQLTDLLNFANNVSVLIKNTK